MNSNGADVPGAQVTVDPSAIGASLFVYENLAVPIDLAANTTYFVVSHEVLNGDTWYEFDTVVFTHPEAAITNGVYQPDATPGVYTAMGGTNHSYGPVDILYHPWVAP